MNFLIIFIGIISAYIVLYLTIYSLTIYSYVFLNNITVGIMTRLGSGWIGYHWSKTHKRLCINIIPFLTIWFVGRGGSIPDKRKM